MNLKSGTTRSSVLWASPPPECDTTVRILDHQDRPLGAISRSPPGGSLEALGDLAGGVDAVPVVVALEKFGGERVAAAVPGAGLFVEHDPHEIRLIIDSWANDATSSPPPSKASPRP